MGCSDESGPFPGEGRAEGSDPSEGFDAVAYINQPRWRHSHLGLERIGCLLGLMGNPQDSLRFVHVAGTNGKGSVCAYLASILQAAGLRTGLFTSPYVMEFSERIRVDGENIDSARLRDATLFVRDFASRVEGELGEHPTEFELMCAVALEHFKRSRCDIVVMEVGLGGRLDSTNVIPAPVVSIINRIALDHTDLLGNTLAQIAQEKAGIIKPGSVVVAWPPEHEPGSEREGGLENAFDVVAKAAKAAGDPLIAPDFALLDAGAVDRLGMRRFSYKGEAYATQMLGSYQPFNAAMAIEAAGVLAGKGYPISQDAIAQGVAQAWWPGRFSLVEVVSRPSGAGSSAAEDGRLPVDDDCIPVIADGGHNPQGARVLAESLDDVFPGRPVVFVMGALADKDYRSMLRAVLPRARVLICITPPNPRALDAADLAQAAREEQPSATTGRIPIVCQAIGQALDEAKSLAEPGDVICVFGSLYSLAEVLRR